MFEVAERLREIGRIRSGSESSASFHEASSDVGDELEVGQSGDKDEEVDGVDWSADGLPFIGTTKIEGLFVNCGQGHLGWTLAMGSAALLADQLQFKDSEIDRNPYLASRSL